MTKRIAIVFKGWGCDKAFNYRVGEKDKYEYPALYMSIFDNYDRKFLVEYFEKAITDALDKLKMLDELKEDEKEN